MSMARKVQPRIEGQSFANRELEAYWEKLRQTVTSGALFVDAAAILDCHDPKYREKIEDFFKRESSNYHFVTSTYVVTEAVRRLVNATSQYPFRGPNGQRFAELALHVLKTWLADYKVKVICVPECVFELAKLCFEKYRNIKGWTLTDAISFEIITQGLGRREIVSGDRGFRDLGLRLFPTDYYSMRN